MFHPWRCGRFLPLLLTWANSNLPRPLASVQSHLLLASRFGMEVTFAHPEGYDLDPDVMTTVDQYCKMNNTNFDIIHDPDEGYNDAHVVYARNWISSSAYANDIFQKEHEIAKASQLTNWITTTERMAKTNHAIFANPMPVERGHEATDEVIDGKNSVIYDVAENRLHVQKALMALIMSDKHHILGSEIHELNTIPL